MLPYARHDITPEDEAAVLAALRSPTLTQGEGVERFETALAQHATTRTAVVVNSGTAALYLALRATGCGPKTTVWTSPISFMATANAALLCGARIAFSDVEATTGLVGGWVQPAQFFIPVTLGGQPITLTTAERQKTVIVDACHGPLTLPVGALAACLSFHPAKHVACGEGGAILTNDETYAARCRMLRDHGRRPDKRMATLSMNFRLPELNCALGQSQLLRYDENVQRRQDLALRYDQGLDGKVETVPHDPDSARHLYQILVEDRDRVQERLRDAGIGTAVHYPPIHLEPFYRSQLGFTSGMLPEAERFASRTLSLPLYPTLTEREQDTIIGVLCG